MEQFLRATAAVLLAAVLGLALGKQGKEIGIVLTIIVCSMVVVTALTYLSPVVDFIRSLSNLAQMQGGTLGILMKIVGIGLIAEISTLISTDAGNATLGKSLQILATAVILWLCVPIFTSLMNLIQGLVGAV